MRITELHLVNFKRFTDLTITNIPESSKLVLLIGSNGSGKSAVLDVFSLMLGAVRHDVSGGEERFEYYYKQTNQELLLTITVTNGETFSISGERGGLSWDERLYKLKGANFYGRTSFRQIPQLTRTSLGEQKFDFDKDSDRPKFFIERDSRFENDVEKITEIILKDFFRSGRSNEQIRHEYIDPINKALRNIFGTGNGTKLQLIEIIPPLEGKIAQINFKKGESEIHYNFLSAGEKEVFNLLINLLSRASLYRDTIYFFDEIDLHLNTRLQYNLLKEITENWIPETSQLWTASHSLGFIEYAKQHDHASIIDFDDLDFDLPRILSPEPKDNPDIYEIAVGKEYLPALFKQMEVYFVENKDRDYYATVGIENTVFVSDNSRNNVYHKVKSTGLKGIVDRDFLSDDDIYEIKKHYLNLRILNYYSIENYMYHPDNLEEYYNIINAAFSKSRYTEDLVRAKNKSKDSIIIGIALARTGYPYFTEPEFNGKPIQNRFKNSEENRNESAIIQQYLNSDELEVFYKVLPMKSYCTQLPERQNIAKFDLVKTDWFKQQIKELLK
ncbi:MAG: AAA family ATPase [Chitinophagaceae bacterium]|nr:AAA family ATPase [Chitinophagaceae bacterium]